MMLWLWSVLLYLLQSMVAGYNIQLRNADVLDALSKLQLMIRFFNRNFFRQHWNNLLNWLRCLIIKLFRGNMLRRPLLNDLLLYLLRLHRFDLGWLNICHVIQLPFNLSKRFVLRILNVLNRLSCLLLPVRVLIFQILLILKLLFYLEILFISSILDIIKPYVFLLVNEMQNVNAFCTSLKRNLLGRFLLV